MKCSSVRFRAARTARGDDLDESHSSEMCSWQRVHLSRPNEIGEYVADNVASFHALAPSVPWHDVRWLNAFVTGPGKSLDLWTLARNGQLVGYVPFLVHPSRVECKIGPLAFYSRRVSRLDFEGSPLFNQDIAEDEQFEYLNSLFVAVAESLDRNQVLFLQCVKEDAVLRRVLTEATRVRRYFHVIRYGLSEAHRLIRLSDEYEAYVHRLGPKTRADLRRTRRRLISHVHNAVYTRRFESAVDVDVFVRDAMAVSSKTWQYRLHESGLRHREALFDRYCRAAELGCFRSYILYVHGTPVAFQVGYLYGDTFFAEDIGYDPDWRKFQIGIFLHTEILMDLLAGAERPKWFDFAPTDNDHKQRLSTDSYGEEFYYLIPRDLKGTALAIALRATICLTDAGRRLLQSVRPMEQFIERFGIRPRR